MKDFIIPLFNLVCLFIVGGFGFKAGASWRAAYGYMARSRALDMGPPSRDPEVWGAWLAAYTQMREVENLIPEARVRDLWLAHRPMRLLPSPEERAVEEVIRESAS